MKDSPKPPTVSFTSAPAVNIFADGFPNTISVPYEESVFYPPRPSGIHGVRLDLLTRALLVRARQVMTRKVRVKDPSARPVVLHAWRCTHDNANSKGKALRTTCAVTGDFFKSTESAEEREA